MLLSGPRLVPRAGAGEEQAVSTRPEWSTLPTAGEATADLCRYCFHVLNSHLRGQPPPPFPCSADPTYSTPIFVTWLKSRRDPRDPRGETSGSPELRGCIGCLEPISLGPGLPEYALRSALQDRRFPPIRHEELPFLSCKLSILHRFERCADVMDWQVGVHGVLINFPDARGRQFSATYLPEVALEHRMTREIALRELVAKAGYQGPCDEELLSKMQVTRYQTVVEHVPYREYVGALGGDGAEPAAVASERWSEQRQHR